MVLTVGVLDDRLSRDAQKIQDFRLKPPPSDPPHQPSKPHGLTGFLDGDTLTMPIDEAVSQSVVHKTAHPERS